MPQYADGPIDPDHGVIGKPSQETMPETIAPHIINSVTQLEALYGPPGKAAHAALPGVAEPRRQNPGVIVRARRPSDDSVIAALNDAAFGSFHEARLIGELRGANL